MFNEFNGFAAFIGGISMIIQETNYTCLDDEFKYTLRKSDFTEEEKNRFKNYTNLCLRFLLSATEQNFTKETCFNSDVVMAKNDTGVSCGYYELTLNFNDTTNYKFNTCFLFNDDIIENKNLGYIIKQQMGFLANAKSSDLKKVMTDFTMEFTNSKGKTLEYSSLSDEFADKDNSYALNLVICKYLLLLFLVLI